jgi:myo-inositol-1(or 4)-monophosphatase
MSDPLRDLRICREAAAAAAEALGRAQGEAQEASLKGPVDLVTAFDREVEALVIALLRAADPHALIVAEEGGGEGARDARRVWYVDPIDGTTNFAHGLPIFCVSLAVVEDGATQAAVVRAPALGWEFCAARGGGATFNGRPLAVSRVPTLERALLVTGFPYDRQSSADNNVPEFAALLGRSQGVRRLGSAALDLCLVARGWLDGYWERKLHAWDIAAGLLIAKEAGARLSDYRGGPVSLERCEVVATNGLIHDALLAALGAAAALGELHGG